jgi:hypothetical protein
VDFYRDVLLELVTAIGAALFVANTYALIRRRADRLAEARESAARSRPGSPVRGRVRTATTGKLAEAPVGRTVTYALLGLVVFLWGMATLTS